MQTTIVSAEWLHDHINDPDLIILDASQKDNVSGLIPSYEGKYIPNARFFDLKNVFSDQESALPNTVPIPESFEEGVRKLGVSNNSKVVVYDNLGVYFSPRVRFLFKVMGHHNVAVLNGGLPAWIECGYESSSELISHISDEGNFRAFFNKEILMKADEIYKNIEAQEQIVIDVRAQERFSGVAPEPRKGIRSGHIPKSYNLPFKRLLKNGRYKSVEELKNEFAKTGINHNKPYVFSCGSGLTACIAMLASELLSDNPVKIYDGSWTEWGQSEYPVEK